MGIPPRYPQALAEIGAEHNTTLVLPLPIDLIASPKESCHPASRFGLHRPKAPVGCSSCSFGGIERGFPMFEHRRSNWKAALLLVATLAAMPATAPAGDLSKYRDFQLGMDLADVAKHAGMVPSQAEVIHRRPALIHELKWRPQSLGLPSRPESAQEVIFSFIGGELFRIEVKYDRYETEGLTVGDIVDAMSTAYGMPETPTAKVKALPRLYGDVEEVIARWQDSSFRFDLIQSSYGPSYRLIGVQKQLDAAAKTSTAESRRLDDLEAPQRDAARLESQAEAAKAKLEKARLLNRPKFRP